jgi:hypothetical protein
MLNAMYRGTGPSVSNSAAAAPFTAMLELNGMTHD